MRVRSPAASLGPQLLGEVVEPATERGVGGELGVHPAPGGSGGDHADVVEVRHQHGAALDDAEPVVRARREQSAVELLGESDRPAGDVAHVHDAVIGEGGRMSTGIGEERRRRRGRTQRVVARSIGRQ